MAIIDSWPDESIVSAKWFRITGGSWNDVQQAINRVINWIALLPGHNYAEFHSPERKGAGFISRGYTLIDSGNSYETLRFY